MGTSSWEVVCDEHGIGGDCEYCGKHHANPKRVKLFYDEA
jgi:hypothetical protein